MSDSLRPHGLYPARLHRILQVRMLMWIAILFSRDLPNPGMEPGLLHYRLILYHLSPQGSPYDKVAKHNFCQGISFIHFLLPLSSGDSLPDG